MRVLIPHIDDPGSEVPPAFAIQGFYGVTLLERRLEPTAALLEVMGLEAVARDGDYIRFAPKETLSAALSTCS